MLTNATIDKLIEMKLTAMADALRIQLDDPKMNEVNFEDRFSMLVDIEYSKRKDNRLKRLIKKAEFEQPDATIAGINYGAGRKLNRDLIDRLSTCEHISEYRNIFIIFNIKINIFQYRLVCLISKGNIIKLKTTLDIYSSTVLLINHLRFFIQYIVYSV